MPQFFNKLWNGEHKGFARYAIVLTALFVLYVGFISHDNVVRWIRAGIELRSQKKQIEMLGKDIGRIDRKINRISNDTDSLEKFARENFHFAEPGDDVYLLPE